MIYTLTPVGKYIYHESKNIIENIEGKIYFKNKSNSKGRELMLYTYNKLIRDNNVKIMEDKGCKVKYEILDDKRYGEELDKKLKEEVEEYLADYSVEEMADVMEVIYAILEYRGTSMEEVEQVRIKKRNRKGAFKNKIFLKDVEED